MAAVEHGEDGRKVHLAFVGLRPRRHRGDLDVADDRMMPFEPPCQVAQLDLHMIEIKLHAHIVTADRRYEGGGLIGIMHEIVRAIAPIDRLDQQRDAGACGAFGGAGKIGNEGGLACSLHGRRHDAGHAMDRTSAERDCIVEGLEELCVEILFAARHAGEPQLPIRSQRRVDAPA